MKLNCIVLLAITLAIAPGCSTVVPPIVKEKIVSYDGNVQNGGIICENDDESLTITQHAVDRYNGMVVTYGKLFTPPLKKGEGIKPGPATNGVPTFIMDAQHATYFSKMNRWRKGLDVPPFKK